LEEKAFEFIVKNFSALNKNLSDIESFLEFSYETFLNIITRDDLVVETEKDISDLILNYIKSRRNLPDGSFALPKLPIYPEIQNENEVKPEEKAEIEEEKSVIDKEVSGEDEQGI